MSTAADAAELSTVAPATTEPLHRRASRGALQSIAGHGVGNLLRMASNLALSRLLVPEDFGLMLLVNVFLQGLSMFSDIGIGPSVVRSKRGDERAFLDTAWTVQNLRGLLLWLLSFAAGAIAAWIYEEPRLLVLLPVAGLSALIAGLESTKLVNASRHLLIGRRTILELGAQVASILAMVGWALVDRSVWALVFGALVYQSVKTIGSHVALPGPNNRHRLEREACRELFDFGRWLLVGTAITFFSMQIDRLLLGKLIPLDALGVYGMAQQLAGLPMILVGALVGPIVFPVLSRAAREEPASFAYQADRVRRILLPGAACVVLGIALLGPAFFRTLYDARYRDACWMVVLSIVPLWPIVLSQTADRALLVLGQTRVLALCSALALAGKSLGGIAGFHSYGIAGFLIGSTLGTLAFHVGVVIALRSAGIALWRQDLVWTLLVAGPAALSALLSYVLSPQLPDLALTALESAIALVVLVPLGLVAWRRLRTRGATA
ncbi:MAG: oligosaccharide flippase family protein [Planctomycetes bacterium]|nr:oligosaccharide flippase family protein [Planctomycetota bacterium]